MNAGSRTMKVLPHLTQRSDGSVRNLREARSRWRSGVMFSVTTRRRVGDTAGFGAADFGAARCAFDLAACALPARAFLFRLIPSINARHCTAWASSDQLSQATPRVSLT